METSTLVKLVIGIVIVLAILPLLPKILEALKTPEVTTDAENLEQIQAAVQAYREATGYYPAALSVLAPKYLDAVPSANNGQPFVYDSQTGKVSLPVTAMPTGREAPGTGLTPMGDAITGQSVQDELNF